MLFWGSGVLCQEADISPVHMRSVTEGLQSPVRLAIDNQDIVYVTDANLKCIVKYSNSGEFLRTIEPGGLPVSIAINSENQIFIGDGETGTIFKLDESGNPTEFYTETVFPSSLVFSPDNHLYVVDSELGKVIVLDPFGNVVRTIGEGTLLLPTGIAFDAINDRVYVSEHGGIGTGFKPLVKIWVFDPQGNLLYSMGSHGNGEGQFYRIQGMCVGRCGKLYVTDPYQGTISVFDETKFIARFGEYGQGLKQLNAPLDVAADSHGNAWISSMNNGSLEVFKIDELRPSSNISGADTSICPGGTSEIAIDFTGSAPWTFTYTINESNPATIRDVRDNPYMLQASVPGIYEVVALSDANEASGCLSGRALISLDSIPVSEFAFSENEREVTFLNASSHADSYTWDFGDTQTSQEKSPVHVYEEYGTYEVVLSAYSVKCGVSVESKALVALGTSTGDLEIDNIVRIYPNPTNGIAIIEFLSPVQSEMLIRISNIKGQIIYSKLFPKQERIEMIDVSKFPTGLYMLTFISNEYFKTTKLIKYE